MVMKEDAGKRNRGEYDVVEIFSPPRICQRARERGIRGGWSLDWMIKDPITGQAWDLRQEHVQKKVLSMLRRDRPDLVVACPPCTMFSQLMTLSGDPEKRDPEGWKNAVIMVEFAITVCMEQMKAGRSFLFEHPLCATSWKLKKMKDLREMIGVEESICHMCAYGMKSKDAFGEAPVMNEAHKVPNELHSNPRFIEFKM